MDSERVQSVQPLRSVQARSKRWKIESMENRERDT
jgi:hypothetical protein